MPTPSIASEGLTTVEFISLRGQVQRVGRTLMDITRPGLDGHAYRLSAKHSVPFQMDGVRDCDNLLNLASVYALCEEFKGKIVTIVDDLGESHTKIVCLDVVRAESYKTIKAVGGRATRGGAGDTGAMLIVRFMFQTFGEI